MEALLEERNGNERETGNVRHGEDKSNRVGEG